MAQLKSKRPACANCGHAYGMHTAQATDPCAKRVPVAWTGTGRGRHPLMGYCKCPKYEPKE